MEVVRSIYDGWLRGDMGIDKFDPEIAMLEWKTIPGAPSAYGLDAVRHYMESFPKHWREIRLQPQEHIDAGDQVVVVARLVGQGRSSGAEVDRTWAYVWTVRAKKVLRMEGYSDRAEALEAVGLEEEGMSQDRSDDRSVVTHDDGNGTSSVIAHVEALPSGAASSPAEGLRATEHRAFAASTPSRTFSREVPLGRPGLSISWEVSDGTRPRAPLRARWAQGAGDRLRAPAQDRRPGRV